MIRLSESPNSPQAIQGKLDGARRKRLGQYFSGLRVARLLAALADARHAETAIDPMSGSGDMLLAVAEQSRSASMFGIEVDPAAAALSRERFDGDLSARFQLAVANAFTWQAVKCLGQTAFDLVITNPPYVRYQSLAGSRTDHGDLPDAGAVRRGVGEIIDSLEHLSPSDRELFQALVSGYSGLSDLAVPSWLLCAALTRPGGRLAMVVPEAWLSRDYALPVQYLLLKLFRLQYVVEDKHRRWFDDALIKTTLVVAERLPVARDLNLDLSDQALTHISLPGNVSDERSLVGGLFPDSATPELDFARALETHSRPSRVPDLAGLAIEHRSLESYRDRIYAERRRSGWLRSAEPVTATSRSSVKPSTDWSAALIPGEVLASIPEAAHWPMTTLSQMSVQVGQGLRTGANGFFYVDLIDERDGFASVVPNRALSDESFWVPSAALRPVVRRQADAPTGYRLRRDSQRGRVMVLDELLHPDDAHQYTHHVQLEAFDGPPRTVMSPDLARFISSAATTNLGTTQTPRYIPNLSAVRTNRSPASRRGGEAPRYWYMLPKMTRRHLPELFVARINSRHPRVILNSQPECVVDANFSTIWRDDETAISDTALLGLLNSTWSIAMMEMLGATLGGGGLKLEATHLRRVPLPALSNAALTRLGVLGLQLSDADQPNDIIGQIDHLIVSSMAGLDETNRILRTLHLMVDAKLRARMVRT